MLSVQTVPTERRVMRKHDNGKEHVVLYLDKESGDLLKEEVFYPNGKMHWTGTYKNNIENGTWQFFFENGNPKTVENYLGGKEHGVTIQYNEYGKKVKEEFWKHGKKIKEVTY
jgi:antitoxin component YwqK of YwqJK toxin-antitoxin module